MSCWYSEMIKENHLKGRKDAEKGEVNWPYDNDDDVDEEMNIAYKKGFFERRKELGDKFKWAQGNCPQDYGANNML